MERQHYIFKLLESDGFRERPNMYLRGDKVLDLVKFLDGFQSGEINSGVKSGLNDFFNQYTVFLYLKLRDEYPDELGNYHWYQIIELFAQKSGASELQIFFKLYDKFKVHERERILSEVEEVKSSMDSHHMNDPANYKSWKKLVEILTRNIEVTNQVIELSDGETISLISEVCEEVYFKTSNGRFLNVMKLYDDKYPDLKLGMIIDSLINTR